ncbi:Rni-like superfamily protein [Thalictrum thalictroides]|uniref:Rni-like superfamily protein n=1 Tax=Thalictrum thalictroides TaxID=46969 RepID=A0A7J6W6C4_THATH|nr:Rni-like superfamily protein [Thalictrum thalictroides]
MTHLHSLHLIGSKMSNKGLQAILAGCPNLEYLDLRCCFEITLEGDVPKELIGRIRKVRLPNEKISSAPVSYDYGLMKLVSPGMGTCSILYTCFKFIFCHPGS